MREMLREVRLASRFLLQRPLFAGVAVVSLALGLGAGTAVLSIVDALLIRTPAGVPDPENVVELGRTEGGRGFDTFSYLELEALREGATPLAEVAGWTWRPLSLSTGGEGERVMGLVASANYFEVMGVRPALGRFASSDEDAVPGTGFVVVLSHRFWTDRFAADPSIIGTDIDINRRSLTVIGVAPATYRGHVFGLDPDVYIPLPLMGLAQPGFDEFDEIRSSWFTALGRLAPGATLEQADAAVATVIGRLADQSVDAQYRRSARAIPLGLIPGGGRTGVATFAGMILGVVGLILLITCANVAGMIMARATTRQREIAIRLAIGAGRGRLIRQLVLESVILFLAGGLAGAALAWWGTDILSAVRLPIPVRLEFDFTPDVRVFGAGLALALGTGLLFGLLPALQATRPGLTGALRNESQSGTGRAGRLRRVFVSGQVALSVILLVVSGLFLRSLQHAASISTGFDPSDIDIVAFDLSLDGYDEERGRLFNDRLMEAIRAQPDVVSAALAIDLPLDLGSHGNPVYPEGWLAPSESGSGAMGTDFNIVTDGYFETLGIDIVQGRAFEPTDRPGSAPVVIVSRGFAERAWPGQAAVGRRVRRDPDSEWLTVVGVADNVKNQMLSEDTESMIYFPARQTYAPATLLVARGRPGAPRLAGLMTGVLREIDPALSLDLPQSLEDYTAVGLLPQRIGATVTTALGLMALLLSALGVYGVVAYMVSRRTREIGVRMALGARRPDVLALILRRGLRLALPGLAAGTILGLGMGRLVRSFILGVAPADPVTFVVMPGVLLLAVIIACLGPARRASSIEPLRALRIE